MLLDSDIHLITICRKEEHSNIMAKQQQHQFCSRQNTLILCQPAALSTDMRLNGRRSSSCMSCMEWLFVQ